MLKHGVFTSAGQIYEHYVLRILKDRGRKAVASPPLAVSMYNSSKDDTFTYPKESAYFMNSDVIQEAKNDTIYIPFESNKKAVDFVKLPWLVQVTLSGSHTFKSLDIIQRNFPNFNNWKILFIIPGNIKADFKPPRKAQEMGAYIGCIDYLADCNYKRETQDGDVVSQDEMEL